MNTVLYVLVMFLCLSTHSVVSLNAQWTRIESGLASSTASDAYNVFHGGSGIRFSGDAGEQWFGDRGVGTGIGVTELALADGYLYASTVHGVMRFVNHQIPFMGANRDNWNPDTTTLRATSQLCARSGLVLARPGPGGLYRSVDQAVSWQRVDIENDTISAFAKGSDCGVYLGTTTGLYHSSDAGASWTSIGNVRDLTVTSILVSSSGSILIGTADNGVYRSVDGGASFTTSSTGLPDSTWITEMVGIGGYIFAGVFFNGVFLSTDDGVSWTAVNEGLPTGLPYVVGSMTIHGDYLFAAHVYQATDGSEPFDGLWRRPLSEMLPPAAVGRSVGQGRLIVRYEESLLSIEISIDSPSDVTIELVDTYGRSIMRQQHGRVGKGMRRFQLNTAEVPCGVYLIVVRTADAMYAQKVLVGE